MGTPSAREIEKALGAELLEALRHHAQTNTKWLERLAGQLVNHTLEVFSTTIPAAGFVTTSWGIAAGCVFVELPEGGRVVVNSGSPAANVPTGLGTWIVGRSGAGHATAVVPLASHQMTIYGAENTVVQWQAYTRPVTPITYASVVPGP